MPDVLDVASLFAGLVCFVLAAVGVPARVNLVALGLAFWLLPYVLDAAATL